MQRPIRVCNIEVFRFCQSVFQVFGRIIFNLSNYLVSQEDGTLF